LKKSKYTIVTEPKDSVRILYNTLTGAVASIEADLEQILQDGNPDEIRELRDEGFVVESDEVDQRARDAYIQDVYTTTGSLSMTVLTTYDCNFSCKYCFQNTMHDEQAMDLATADALVAWLSRVAGSARLDRLGMALSGGEPLLTPDVCCHLCGKVRELCEKEGIKWSFTVVTNGFLLTREIFDRLYETGVRRFTVDVDGPKENHDSYRILRSGGPTFDVIMANLKYLVQHEDVSLTMKVGVTRANHELLGDFMQYLDQQGFRRDNFLLFVAPIANNLVSDCYNDVPTEEMKELSRLPIQRGFKTRDPLTLALPCTAKYGTSYVIGPDGSVYDCPILVNNSKWLRGKIEDAKYPRYSRDYHPLPPKCVECEAVALCLGGCLYQNEAKGGGWGAACSKSDILEQTKRILLAKYASSG